VSSAKQSTNYSNSNYLPDYAFKGPNKFTHTKKGVGQWWEVGFGQDYWVDRVRVLNRKNCCGGRLAKTEVFIGDQKCGQVEPGTKNGQWYTVECQEPVFGNKVRLVTVQKEYLSISGIEVYTGEEGEVEEEGGDETEEIEVSGPATKLTLEKPSMNRPYSNSNYKADFALMGGSKTTITKRGVGNWWKASFVGGDAVVEKVRVKNRHDCCGARIVGTKVTVGGQECGIITSNPGDGKYIEVKCKEPLIGGDIQLTTTKNTWLQINAVEPFGWSVSSTKTVSSTSSGSASSSTTTSSSTITRPSGPTAKIPLKDPSMNQPYSTSNFKADFALMGGSKTSITKSGVGMWWKATFVGG